MECAHGLIRQHGIDVTGRVDLTLKTTPAAGDDDFWGGALRIPRGSQLRIGKATLHLEDGRAAQILVDAMCDDETDSTQLVTFFGLALLRLPPLDESEPRDQVTPDVGR